MSEEKEPSADLSFKIAGQEANVRNIKSLNTIATVCTLFGVLMIIYILWTHQEESRAEFRQSKAEFVNAMKEQTTAIRDGSSAQREQTCMLKFDIPERKANAEWCKQVSGAR